MQHLSGLVAFLVDELVADGEEPGEAGLDDLVEVRPVLAVAGPEAICAADGQQALQACHDGGGIIGVQQLDGEIHKGGPSVGEVVVQDALEDGDELGPHEVL